MLVSAYIIPPCPLLLPHIGGEQSEKFKSTHHALQVICASMAAVMPEIVLLISQYGAQPHGIAINIADEYFGSLQSFGDLTRHTFPGSPSFVHQMLRGTKHSLVAGITEPALDYASVVACLISGFETIKFSLVPFYPSPARTPQEHVRAGRALCDAIKQSSRRVALITVGDLSHHLSAVSPEGYHAEGILFDTSVISALKKKSIRNLLESANKYGDEAKESGILAYLLLLGALDEVRCTYAQLSYDAPFGIGYLTAEYII